MKRQYGALSGIAIFLIVLNHAITVALDYPAQLGYSTVDGWIQDILTVLQALGGFAVPIFLFISGAFLTYAARGNQNLSFRFVLAGLRHIIWPYIVWSLVFYILVFFRSDESYSAFGYIKNLLVGYPYHFVPLLVFWYILSPLLIRVGTRHGLLLLLVIGFYQLILILIIEQDALGLAMPEWTEILVPPVLFNTMALWGIYLPLGVVLSLNEKKSKQWLLRLKWLFVLITVLLFALGILNAISSLDIPLARYFVPLPFMFVMPLVHRNRIPLVRQFERIGRRAYGIYLIHLIVLDLVLVMIQMLIPQLLGYTLLLIVILLSIALAAPLWLMEAAARGPTRKIYRYVFG